VPIRLKEQRIRAALAIAAQLGQVDGAHHKAWVIDQMVRCLTADNYDAWVADYCFGDEGAGTYSWDEGTAP
jgi:hypothetical protein